MIRYENTAHAVGDGVFAAALWVAGWFHPAAGEVDPFRPTRSPHRRVMKPTYCGWCAPAPCCCDTGVVDGR